MLHSGLGGSYDRVEQAMAPDRCSESRTDGFAVPDGIVRLTSVEREAPSGIRDHAAATAFLH